MMNGRPGSNLSSYQSADFAEIYDLLYEGRKDYGGEADRVTTLIRERKPDAATLLDVACGTGNHLVALAKNFDFVAGVDLSEPMINRAIHRLPNTLLRQADMRAFDLGRQFDAVISLFSSVGYLSTVDDLNAAITTMANHLAPGGVLVVEPWYFPDTFVPGFVSSHAVSDGNRAVARVARTVRTGDTSRIEIHHLIGDGAEGIEHWSSADTIALFERDQYLNAFRRNDLQVEYLPAEGGGTGMFIGVGKF